MTYYAVTNDPNELTHWGVKGMKWGVVHDKPRHSGSRRPRSAAYKKAQSKLGKMMKSGIKKAEAHWKEYNSPKAKEARFMQKAMQQARNGTLKYGKLSDAQVKRVTERLALERNARQLGSTENPSYLKRIRSAVGEGVVRGIGQGTGAYIEERFRGRGRTTAEIKADKRKTEYENKHKTREQKAKRALAEEYYKTAYEEGEVPKYKSDAKRAKYLAEVKKRNKESEYRSSIQKAYDEQDARTRAVNEGKNRADFDKFIKTESYMGNRKLGGGSAVKRLNEWNEEHEKNARKENARLEAADRALARAERQKSVTAERSYATKQVMQEYAKTQRQRAQEAEVRRNAEQQRAAARQARLKEVNRPPVNKSDADDARRRAIDRQNTSKYRKRHGR